MRGGIHQQVTWVDFEQAWDMLGELPQRQFENISRKEVLRIAVQSFGRDWCCLTDSSPRDLIGELLSDNYLVKREGFEVNQLTFIIKNKLLALESLEFETDGLAAQTPPTQPLIRFPFHNKPWVAVILYHGA